MRKDPFDDGRPPILDERQHDYLSRWLRDAADRLGLRDWRVFASPFAAKDAGYATSFVLDNSDEQWIAVGVPFLGEFDDAERRATLVHELLHPFFHRVTRMAERLYENELGKRTEAVVDTAVEVIEEQHIDRLAHAIAGWLPAVEWP